MKCLVTGPGGFLGRYIVEQLLARGDQVVGLARRPQPELEQAGMNTVLGDLEDRPSVVAACQGVDAVIHVAGLAGVWGPWKKYHAINTLGTQAVVEGCLTHGVSRLVYTSTPSVTFDGRDQCGVDESAPYPTRWLCHYPHSKALAEQHVLSHNAAPLPAGGRLYTCSLRPHLIWGPRDNHLIPRLISRARSGRLRIIGDGQNLIDCVYVENAAAAHLLAVDRLVPDSPVCGRPYFITQGQPVNCWDWINEVLSLADLPPLRKRLSFRSAYLLGSLLETLYTLLRIPSEPPMTRFVASQLSTSHHFSLHRASTDLSYTPTISHSSAMLLLASSLRASPKPVH